MLPASAGSTQTLMRRLAAHGTDLEVVLASNTCSDLPFPDPGDTMNKFAPALLVLSITLALSACNTQESPEEVNEDVSAAQADAQEDVSDAAHDAAVTAADANADVVAADPGEEKVDARADATEDNAQAQYDLAVTRAEGERKIAKEQCDALPSDQQSACNKTADAAFDTAKAAAQTRRDAAEAVAEGMKK